MTYEGSFVKLDNLNEPFLLVLEVSFLHEVSDILFHFFVFLLGWVIILWEDILKKGSEKWNIISDELGQVHITKGTCDNHLLISTWWLSSLGVTSGTQDGENVSKTEIIMTLFGKLLFAKLVKHIELN